MVIGHISRDRDKIGAPVALRGCSVTAKWFYKVQEKKKTKGSIVSILFL